MPPPYTKKGKQAWVERVWQELEEEKDRGGGIYHSRHRWGYKWPGRLCSGSCYQGCREEWWRYPRGWVRRKWLPGSNGTEGRSRCATVVGCPEWPYLSWIVLARVQTCSWLFYRYIWTGVQTWTHSRIQTDRLQLVRRCIGGPSDKWHHRVLETVE